MGNRFRNMAGYKGIVTAHAALAAITFLLVIPAAIFMARFYHRNPRRALRIHIWLQISAVFLATAAFILGFLAVGPKRALTNPHHGIGVALYTLVLVQAFGGAVIHKIEKGKERFKIPLKLMVSQLISLNHTMLIEIASSMARSPDLAARYCASPLRSYPIWFAEGFFHLVCSVGRLPPDPLLCPVIQEPALHGL